MKYIYILHILALFTEVNSKERRVRAKAGESVPPSASPTNRPTRRKRTKASKRGTNTTPSNSPSLSPIASPSISPSTPPSNSPTFSPSRMPSKSPSLSPTASPSNPPAVYFWNETAKLTASDGAADDEFGYSVAVSHNVLIIGAHRKDGLTGSAYVFEKNVSTGYWRETAKLTASDAATNDYFGRSVSISDNIAIVGAIGDNSWSGSAYVFEKNHSTGYWNETSKLTASDSGSGCDAGNQGGCDAFGSSVSISGNIAIIGAASDTHIRGFAAGSAYVFEKDESSGLWNEKAKLTASDGYEYDYFGNSVDISGNIAIVGADGNDDSGSAYVFERNDGTGKWNNTAKIIPSDRTWQRIGFGGSVSVSGSIAVVGASKDGDFDESGSAYVFEKSYSSRLWNETFKLIASDGGQGDRFGYSVSVSGNIAIVGAYVNGWSGAVYVFERNAATGFWNETAKLTASDRAVDLEKFGYHVSLSGNVAIVGTPDDDGNCEDDSGSAYVFEIIHDVN